jgi:hypothetical protein
VCLGVRVMCHPSVLARFACIDLFFLVRTTYIDLRHAGAHMMIWYARWALVWNALGRSSPFGRPARGRAGRPARGPAGRPARGRLEEARLRWHRHLQSR